MDTISYFDFNKYMARITMANALAMKEDFVPCTCAGLGHLNDVLSQYRKKANFVASFDMCEGGSFKNSGGWREKRMFSAVIIAGYKCGDSVDREKKMAMIRELFRQFKSRILHDRTEDPELRYLDTTKITSRELGSFMPESVCIHFTIIQEEPENLCYNEKEWLSEQQ